MPVCVVHEQISVGKLEIKIRPIFTHFKNCQTAEMDLIQGVRGLVKCIKKNKINLVEIKTLRKY